MFAVNAKMITFDASKPIMHGTGVRVAFLIKKMGRAKG